MKNKIAAVSFFILFTWASVATILLFKTPEYTKLWTQFTSETTIQHEIDNRAEFDFINRFLEKYYVINDSSLKGHQQFFSSSTSVNLHDYFVKERIEILKTFKSKKGSQNFDLLNLSYDKKSDEYNILVRVKDLLEEKENEYLIVATVTIGHDKNELYIKDWKERVIKSVPNEQLGTALTIEKNSFATVALPCRYTRIRYDKESINVESSLLKKQSRLVIKTDTNFKGKTKLTTSCGRLTFELQLNLSNQVAVLFRSLSPANGKLSVRKLTKKETVKKILKEQLGVDVK